VRAALCFGFVTQPNDPQPTAELMARTLTSMRAAYADLTELAQHRGGMAGLVNNSHGTALLHDLRREVDQLNKLLPFKG
jgi:hypothetical protein